MTKLVCALLLSLTQVHPSAPTVTVRLSTSNVSVGERFQVTVAASGPRGTTWEFPKEVSDGATELTLSRNPATTASTGIYDAQAFAVGPDVRVPEIRVAYTLADASTGTITSTPVPLNVISSIAATEVNPAPADFAPPRPVQASRAFWVASTILALMLLCGIALLVRRLRFPKKLPDISAVPPLSPEEQALNALNQLATAHTSMEPRAFYIVLIQILKQYLEIRLDAPVLEMTSTETVLLAKGHPWTSPHAPALRDLVFSADSVKFAGSSDNSNAERHIQLVRDLVGRIDRLRQQTLAAQPLEARQGRTA